MAPIKPLGVPKKETVMNIVVAGASGALGASPSVAGAMKRVRTSIVPVVDAGFIRPATGEPQRIMNDLRRRSPLPWAPST
jgi:hypothetical protein